MIKKRIRRICKEYWLIENYEKAVNDETQVWICHHRIEVSEDGLHTLYTRQELDEAKLVYDRPPEELIFLTKSEHCKLHSNTIESKEANSLSKKGRILSEENKKGISNALTGRHLSEEIKRKIRDALTGRPSGMSGKHHSEETKKKMSESRKTRC